MIRIETRRDHETLGAMYFDDGSPDPQLGGSSREPMWIARPSADEDLEFYISGTLSGPDPHSLELAERVAAVASRILAEAIALAGRPLSFAWFDCQKLPLGVALTDEVDVYHLWRGELDAELVLSRLELGSW